MARVDPLIKSSVVAAIQKVKAEGRVANSVCCDLAATYSLSESTVRSWARILEKGGDPCAVGERSARAEQLNADVFALLVLHGNQKRAWEAAHEAGHYRHGYRAFVNACQRLDPALLRGLLSGRKDMLNRLPVMSYPAVARNEIWVIDHTQSDIRVVPDRGKTPFRPWVTIIRDKGSRMVMAVRYSPERISSAHVLSCLVAAVLGCTPHSFDGTFIGGMPESILVDNGGENTAGSLVEGLARLGTAILPTTPGHSWQNGAAENIIGVFQKQFERAQPGYVRSGQAIDGSLRAVANTYKDQDPQVLLHFAELQRRAQKWAVDYNAAPGGDGTAPQDLWLDDEASIVTRSLDEMRWAMLTLKGAYAVTKNGMYVQNREYQGSELTNFIGRGKVLTVRTLPGVTEWIEVWDGDVFVGRIHEKSRLSPSDQDKILEQRRTITSEVGRAERASQRNRDQDAIAAHADATPGDDPVDPMGANGAGPVRKRKSRADKAHAPATDAAADAIADAAADRYPPLSLKAQESL